MTLRIVSKAQVLEQLRPVLTGAKILPSLTFEVSEWRAGREAVIRKITQSAAMSAPYIVRSSSLSEDGQSASNAGKYTSVLNVAAAQLERAIEETVASYGPSATGADQVFVQPMLKDATLCGVMSTVDPVTGAPYYVINYDTGGDTAAVTSGSSAKLKVQFVSKAAPLEANDPFFKLIGLARELEKHLGTPNLDVEFSYTKAQDLYLFQVRPLVLDASRARRKTSASGEMLTAIEGKVERLSAPHPYLHGSRTVLGVMPDWNPAEMIGIRPKPLALSLYKELITDNIWAYQRDNYGYKNLRSFPLLVDFYGLPYIDVRISFNSFLPKDIDPNLSDRLVNYYIDRLLEKPDLHDRVEFDIVFSCYTFDLQARARKLLAHGFSEQDCGKLVASLRSLTNRIINRQNGLWAKDAEKIDVLKNHHALIHGRTDGDEIAKIYWLIEDCKRYGTLPFAGLARAGFIAVQMLNSMVSVGVFTAEQRLEFLNSLDSVSSQMVRDLAQLDRTPFLAKYGHLRPGTYDILSPRYDERPDLYFDWDQAHRQKPKPKANFQLSPHQTKAVEKLLTDQGLEHDVAGLFSFLKAAIEGRESSKFAFTRNLSDVLSLVKQFGARHGIDETDLPYLNIQSVLRLYGSCLDVKDFLREEIAQGKSLYEKSLHVILPPLIARREDLWSFELPENKPNFVTHKTVTGSVVRDLANLNSMKGSIVMIPSADPGYDWIFNRGIAGFITAYGGVNSHMAIRAGELGLPAVVGAGEKLFQQWVQAEKIHIDCANQRVEILH